MRRTSEGLAPEEPEEDNRLLPEDILGPVVLAAWRTADSYAGAAETWTFPGAPHSPDEL